MELRAGYKQTEIGLIPEKWDVKQLKSLLKSNPAYGINAAAVPLEGNLPTYIRITDISEDGYFSPTKTVGVNHAFSKNYYLEQGDLVFARTGASVGKSYLYNSEDGKLVYAGFLIKISPDENFLLPFYLSQYVKTKAYWNWVQVMSMRSGQPGINGNEYGQLLVPLPPTLDEQAAIANALTDADALIGSLQKLIGKKRQIKQGSMQTLLNPYENGMLKEGWMVQKVGEICEKITTGKLDANAMVEHGDYPFFTCAKEHYWIDKYAFDTEALLVSGNGANVGYIHYYNGKFNAYQRTYVLSGFSNHIHFLKLYMERNLQERIRIEVNAGNTPYIVMGTLTEMDVFLPIDISEQIHIAKILSDMDSEITALENKLAKYQQIKQGMMQNLLTGRIRLV